MAVEEVDVLQVNTQPSVTSIAELRKQIKALQGELLGLEEGTEEYNKKLVEVADKSHQLKEINEQVARSSQDFGDRLSNVNGVVAGMSGAIQTALGTLSLFGVEVGDDVKMLKLLQSAMAITQGVAAIDAGVKSFKALSVSIRAATTAANGLKSALIKTGIGAFVVVLGVLVAKIVEMVEATDDAARANDRLAASIKRLNAASDARLEATEYQAQLMEAEGKTAREVYEFRRNALTKMYNDLSTTLFALRIRINAEESEEEKKSLQDRADEVAAQMRKIGDQRVALEWKMKLDEARARTEGEKKAAEDAAAARKEAEAKAEAERKAEAAQRLKDYEDELAIRAQMEQEAREANERTRTEAELNAETEYQMQRAALIIANEEDVDEKLLELDMQYRDKREELLRTRFEWGLISESEFNNQIAALEVEAAEMQIEQEERVTEKVKEEAEKRKKIQQNYVAATKAIMGGIGGILSSLGSMLEQGGQEWKNVMTAEAIISTIKGGVDAYMGMVKTIPGWAGIIAGGAAAATVVAAGMAEVAKIQSTEISKASAPGGGGATTSTPRPAAVSVNAQQITQTRMVDTNGDVVNLADQRVYVVEHDITDAQRRVRVTTDNATY